MPDQEAPLTVADATNHQHGHNFLKFVEGQLSRCGALWKSLIAGQSHHRTDPIQVEPVLAGAATASFEHNWGLFAEVAPGWP